MVGDSFVACQSCALGASRLSKFWELLKLPFEAGLASSIHLGLPRSLRHPYLGLVGWLPHDQVHSASALLDQMMMAADALPLVGMVVVSLSAGFVRVFLSSASLRVVSAPLMCLLKTLPWLPLRCESFGILVASRLIFVQ